MKAVIPAKAGIQINLIDLQILAWIPSPLSRGLKAAGMTETRVMLAYLKGKIRHKTSVLKKDNFVVAETGGVGYKVFTLAKLAEKLASGQEAELYLHTHVAEGVFDLYGFTSQEELEFFEILISLSGIGPKSAMDILEKAKVEDLRQAAQTNNAELLNKVSGIGPKTAQKIVAGLKEKLGAIEGSEGWDAGFGDALEALVGLGYSPYQARDALSQCSAAEMTEKVKEALKILGRK